MKKNYACIFFIILVFPFAHLTAKPVRSLPLSKKIDNLIGGLDKTLNIGIMVQNAQTGQALYKKNVDRYFLPASNMKLFTAFAALNYLGVDFKFKTSLFVDMQKNQAGVLNDNVYFKFTGDPTLSFTQIDHLVSALSKAGILEIKGDILIDDSAFDSVAMSPGSVWDDQDFCFGAPSGALMLDRNCVTANLKPGANSKQKATLELPGYPQFIRFENQVVTGDPKSKTECVFETKKNADSNYSITGCIKAGEVAQKIEMAVLEPRIYFKSVLSHLLNQHKILHAGSIKFQKLDSDAKFFASESSKPLNEMIAIMLKESDNAIANALFKTMGAHYFQTEGNWKNGKAALKAILSSTKEGQAMLGRFKMIDGSGLSRYNYVTPRQVLTLLNKAFLDKDFSFFFTALPISGVDGTLKFRMNQPETFRKVRAKTGTMGGVTALSGFAETNKKQTLIFVIIINGFIDDAKKYKDLEDKICAMLIQSA